MARSGKIVKHKIYGKQGRVYNDENHKNNGTNKILVHWDDGTKTAVSATNLIHIGFFD